MTTAADAINRSLVRIASRGLRNSDLNRVSRLLLRKRRKENERADNQPENDDEYNQSHGASFCRA